MKFQKVEQQIEEEYHVSWYIIAYKFIFGLAELLLGIGIALYGKIALSWYDVYVTQEFSEDPHDLVIRLTRGFVPNFLTHNSFLVFYLCLLGSAKIAGAIGLIYKQTWGADLLIVLTVLMLPFQIIQLVMHPSLLDFLYISLGIFIALYLVNFHPKKWAHRMVKKIKR